ncbi:hypothetical protein ABZS66_60160 [Dactylosporangium sp. NPDC005572]|uniref:hypothetical protein n=1 Tax=Dactylosporangium sp. NPDC005572 TaxID=3156889 RepID=UPI0033BEC988
MDPQHHWQQPQDQTGAYGPPPGQPYPPQQHPPQQYPQQHYPPQQPQQPYSAVPYNQPYSAPPQQQYQHPGPYQPPTQYQPPAPVAPPKRNRWFAALVISAVLLVIMAVAVVVVATTRGNDNETPAAGDGTTSSSPKGPVDACLVGKWKQTGYQKQVVLGDTDVGTRESLGTIKMTGGGKQWTINADGSAIEDDAKTVYSGKTPDGRTVTATFSGSTEWTLKTDGNQLSYAGKESTASVVISVNGASKGRIDLEPNTDPVKYTCTGDVWRTTSNSDPDAFGRFDRVK